MIFAIVVVLGIMVFGIVWNALTAAGDKAVQSGDPAANAFLAGIIGALILGFLGLIVGFFVAGAAPTYDEIPSYWFGTAAAFAGAGFLFGFIGTLRSPG